jgi:acetyl-CoA acyltransferase
MSGLLAGLPVEVPGTTVNRLCGSGMDAVGLAARSIKSGETELMIAGGVESMSRAPFVMGKAESPSRAMRAIYDTTIGWRFVNPLMKKLYETHSMPQTADNVAAEFNSPRRPGRLRRALAAALGRPPMPPAASSRDLVPVVIPQQEGRPGRLRHRRASAPGNHAGDAGQAEGRQWPRTQRHRRQRLRRQ